MPLWISTKNKKLDSTLNENGLHRLFFERVPQIYEDMDMSVWSNLGDMAWRTATLEDQMFLTFCKSFVEVSGEPTKSESDYWDAALAAEARIRAYLVENEIQIVKQEDFDLSVIADGFLAGRKVHTLQANYGVSVCGSTFNANTREQNERKYQKALKISERLAMMGCSSRDNLPYFNASEHLARGY